MAKIIYSISGEGMGHATRSKPIIEHLIKKHKVKIFSSGKSYSYINKNFNDVNEMQGIYIKYKNNSVNEFGTIFHNISNFPKILSSFNKFKKIIKKFKPDLIISDFEAISAYAALFSNTPIINIDNQHIYDKTYLKFPKKLWLNYLETRLVDCLIIPHAKYYFITTFFYPKIKSKNAFLIPPILRKNITNMKTKGGDYFLVYQTSDTNKKLIETLKKIDKKFIIYGFNKNKTEKNIIFRKFDEKLFFNELANCKAIITNGGFTLISEALYLEKPVLSIPVKRQFEQIINAIHLDKAGYGKFIKFANKKQILNFIDNLYKYKNNLKKYKKEDNSKLLKKLDSLISRFSS